jgi:hypothetical protein
VSSDKEQTFLAIESADNGQFKLAILKIFGDIGGKTQCQKMESQAYSKDEVLAILLKQAQRTYFNE